MKHPHHRRSVLMAAGLAVATLGAGATDAKSDVIRGTVEFAEGGPIPKGVVGLHLEDPSAGASNDRPVSTTDIESDGKSDTLSFTLTTTGSRKAEIVARLERSDGWLIARGSAETAGDSPVRIVLYSAAY